MRKIKLIWDFRGPDAEGIAKHHAIHLREFADREKILSEDIGHTPITDVYSTAHMVVNENDMLPVRDALRPHRGEVATAPLYT